ncbi:TRAPP II complex [Exophiala viscosa]|uniref:TRAPP II complex n=1 Tax=Exophiala viscosa TaxID=2486360 RepID=A0AAN6DUM7_9EURO|nr:TRAPP II complex [Exophiala viscosa]
MGYNPFDPTAGAKVNVLCVPAGPVTPDRFQKFLKSLQNAAIVKLKVVEPSQSAEDDSTETGREDGSILYDISAGQDLRRSPIFPFETNSRCQILLGIIDGERVEVAPQSGSNADGVEPNEPMSSIQFIEEDFLQQTASSPGLLIRQLIWCGQKVPSSPDSQNSDILFLPDSCSKGAASDLMVKLSKRFIVGVSKATEDLQEQPISMVPGGKSDPPPRSRDTPNLGQGSSTPVSAHSSASSPTPKDNGVRSDTSMGRFNVVRGMFQMQSGMWSDAITSLSEGASTAGDGRDHLWHGKALESLLICMILLSWSDLPFTIPPVCRSLPNRRDVLQAGSSRNPADLRKTLAQLLPPMVETILELYTRVSNLDLAGSLQDILRESRVRLVNLLACVKGTRGVLSKHYLNQMVLGHAEVPGDPDSLDGEPVATSKAGLANILIDTLQASQASNDIGHYTSILVAVSSSLSTLGLDRKHAFYLKMLMQQFVYKLIEARKIGASEVGVHPAAGLPPVSLSNGVLPEMAHGTRVILSLAAAAYGSPLPAVPPPQQTISADVHDVQDKLRIWASDHASGDVFLKLEMLRACVSVCEALPDVPAGLHFSSHILRGAKQAVTMPLQQPGTAVPLITADEQARLIESMKRAVSAASRLGAEGYRATYWDDFLVRDVFVFERDSFAKLIAHKPSDLSKRGTGIAETIRDPFIFNPFSTVKSVVAAPVLVAEEKATFAVLLQNPLEIEVEIDQIQVITKGCGFTPSQHSVVLGPLSVQTFTLSGTPTGSGDLEIIGCRASIRDCNTQDFFVFKDDWQVPSPPKQNAVSRRKIKTKGLTGSDESDSKPVELDLKIPVSTSLKLKVIDPQPRLTIKLRTLQSPAIMLLEGERRVFEVDLVNESSTVAADFVLVTTEDSVTTRLQEALTNKDLNPADLYEFQNQLAASPAIDVHDQVRPESDSVLRPGGTAGYKVTVVGRPGLVNAAVLADYAYLGSPSSEVKGTFYTRQVRFPITVTVNGSIEILRCNILPLHSDFVWNPDSNGHTETRDSDGSRLSHWLQMRPNAGDYCMLSLDLRNVWPQPLSINIQARKPAEDVWDDTFSVHETLQPGHVTRVVLLIPRLFVQNPYASIPNLDTQKQFVVTTSKLSAEAEAASRESFWYREELLKYLRGTWKEATSDRHGEIDLRKGIRLSPRMIDALKIDHVEIEYSLAPVEGCDEAVKQIGHSHFVVKPEVFAALSVRVRNRTEDTLGLILRLQPALRHQPHNIALDLSRRFAWSGVLQRALHPAIEPGGVYVAELGIIALVQGDYEVNASVEEIKGRRLHATSKTADPVGASSDRRIWHARSPCLIDALEG